MPSWLKQDRVGPILVRQIVGGLLLISIYGIAVALEADPFQDLYGMTGLWTLFALCLLVPARWLPAALLTTALILGCIGAYWFTVWALGGDKAVWAWPGFFAASAFCLAAWHLALVRPE